MQDIFIHQYSEVFQSAATIGNHDMAGSDYSAHFNNPNSEDKLGSTAKREVISISTMEMYYSFH